MDTGQFVRTKNLKQFKAYRGKGEGHHTHIGWQLDAAQAEGKLREPFVVAICGVSTRIGGTWEPEEVTAKPDCGSCLHAAESGAQIVALATFVETAEPAWLNSEAVAVENGKPSEGAVLDAATL